jgi:chromatin remodeling complex protein RSC6
VVETKNNHKMKAFKLSHNFIGFIGLTEYEYTNAVFCLHDMIKNNQDWVDDYPKGTWFVEIFDTESENAEYKVVYKIQNSKIKKLQKDGLF